MSEGLDSEIREAERRLVILGARAGQPRLIRPVEDMELPADPWDGEEIMFAFDRPSLDPSLRFSVHVGPRPPPPPRIKATGGMRIVLVAPQGGGATVADGHIRPMEPSPFRTCFVRLMALLPEKAWASTALSGSWEIDA